MKINQEFRFSTGTLTQTALPVTSSFMGCIQDMTINDELISFSRLSAVFGPVNLKECPGWATLPSSEQTLGPCLPPPMCNLLPWQRMFLWVWIRFRFECANVCESRETSSSRLLLSLKHFFYLLCNKIMTHFRNPFSVRCINLLTQQPNATERVCFFGQISTLRKQIIFFVVVL